MFHNSNISLFSLIRMAKEKKLILSLHDPWFFTGHCVHFQDCEKWKSGCGNCPDLSRPFPIKEDTTEELWNLKKKIFDLIDVDLIVTSSWMYNIAKTSPITKNKRIHLIPFGIDTNFYSPNISKNRVRKKFGINSSDKVLFFRSQNDFKGTNYIIDALKHSNLENVTLITCSEKGNLSELQEKYKIIELGNAPSNKILQAYNACDIFLMPSIGESFGMMAIEAMSCERPVIIFNNTAMPSVTFAPECGILVDNKNSNALKNAIEYYLNNSTECKRRGKLGRELVLQHYGKNKYLNAIKELYEKVYSRTPNNTADLLIGKTKNNNFNSLKQKLNMISLNFFEHRKSSLKLIKYDVNTSNNLRPIKYSDFAVQEIIDEYNNKLYSILKGDLKNLSLWHKTKNFLKETPFYPILRRIKYLFIR